MASVEVAASFTEVYVGIIAIIASKCSKVDSGATDLVAACEKFKAGVVNLKTYVSSLDSILPVQSDLSPLPNLSNHNQGSPNLWNEEILNGYQLLKGNAKWPESLFPDDKLKQSLFSPLNQDAIDKVLNQEASVPGPLAQLLSVSFNTLAQTRETRRQLAEHFNMLKWTLAACLLPQLTLLLLLCMQFVVNRRRRNKMKKRIQKAEESHQMIARIRGNNALRENSRFIEV